LDIKIGEDACGRLVIEVRMQLCSFSVTSVRTSHYCLH